MDADALRVFLDGEHRSIREQARRVRAVRGFSEVWYK